MIGAIAINEVIFAAAQSKLSTSISSFTPEIGEVADISSQAIALEHYIEQFNELASLMKLYHDLLTRDKTIIQKAHDNITETDSALPSILQR